MLEDVNVLIVEDDPDNAVSYRDAMELEGYDCDLAGDFESARRAIAERLYDLILLDIELPGGSGTTLLTELRKDRNRIPVILITARGELEQRIEGLDVGADDYLVKPVALKELLARVRAVLRRAGDGGALTLRLADVELHVAGRKVFRGGTEVELTGREFDLLEHLMRHAGHTCTYHTLAGSVLRLPTQAGPVNNVLAVHVSHLRKKLGGRDRPVLIHTIHGTGFCMKDPDGP